jgi:hypothetical protein
MIVIRQKYSETFFAYSRFDSKIIRFNTSYFPYDGKNGIQSSKSNGKGSQFCNMPLSTVICQQCSKASKFPYIVFNALGDRPDICENCHFTHMSVMVWIGL